MSSHPMDLSRVVVELGGLARATLRVARTVVVAVVGAVVLAGGLALLFLPGPAFLVIPLGLAILATEFSWARRWLHLVRALVDRWLRWRPSR